jgi:hypothetical protein
MSRRRTPQPDVRRTDLLEQLHSERNAGNEPSTLRRLVEDIELLDRSDVLLRPQPSKWSWPTTAAIVILIVLSIGFAVRVPVAQMDLDAEVNSFLLAFGDSEPSLRGEIPVNGDVRIEGAYEIDRVESVGEEHNALQVQAIDDITLAKNTVLRVRHIDGSTSLGIEEGALSASMSYAPTITDANPFAKQLVVHAGGAISLPERARFVLEAGDVGSLIISDTRDIDASPHIGHLPSILEGTLTVPLTGKEVALGAGSRLQLSRLSAARCFVRADEELRLMFSGKAAAARLFGFYGPVAGKETNLLPTLFEVAISWPWLASTLAAISAMYAALVRLRSTWTRVF